VCVFNRGSVIYCTGWRRLIGSPKLQIIFHKRATKYRLLLRKMTYKDKGSYESTPPCKWKTTRQTIELSRHCSQDMTAFAVCCSAMRSVAMCCRECCSVLQCVAVCCGALRCIAVRCRMLQSVAVCCKVCCSVL